MQLNKSNCRATNKNAFYFYITGRNIERNSIKRVQKLDDDADDDDDEDEDEAEDVVCIILFKLFFF